jgi:glycerol-3-phosphate dehydrogenase
MIRRDPEQATSRPHDLIVIGAGIYGVAMALEAARRGLRVVLVERDDFGGATSWNSLRILHGGLRYLQTLDLPRFFDSVAERRWFCRHFPELVAPAALPDALIRQGDETTEHLSHCAEDERRAFLPPQCGG